MTNYEKIMIDMTPEKLAELISENTLDNPCNFCAYRDETRCGFRCIDGTEEWMKQKADDAAQNVVHEDDYCSRAERKEHE